MSGAEDFLKQKQLFQLGDLPTETPHPKTVNLSHLAQSQVLEGLQVLRGIDLSALNQIEQLQGELKPLFEAVHETLSAGHRVFLVGCGATGRLSLSLEYLWRRKHRSSDQVRSLMAGGDVALVHSLEGFEDFPELGARHLREMGFTKDDLLIATTEGGETPYVIGATEEAAKTSNRAPYFLYCNTREILCRKVERSRRVLENPAIQSICLEVGPMALTGSTRMQASTVLMLAVGLALDYGLEVDRAFADLQAWIRFLENSEYQPLKGFIYREAETYLEGGFTCYAVNHLAITVFTDTTERAPTFNLAPFDNPKHVSDRHSLTYISLPKESDTEAAWKHLLARPPRPLEWPEVHAKTSRDYLMSFDFGRGALAFREKILKPAVQHLFTIDSLDGDLIFRFREIEERFSLPRLGPLFDHLTLKMLLNMHSTLVMGRLNRFEGNLMTWVYPSNGKLVDRAARYTQILLQQRGLGPFDYDSIVRAQFACKAGLSPQESIVHKTIEKLLADKK